MGRGLLTSDDRPFAGQRVSAVGAERKEGALGRLVDRAQRPRGLAGEFESGSWSLRCGASSHGEMLRRHLPGDLFLRQLRRLGGDRVLVCSTDVPVDRKALSNLARVTWLNSGWQLLEGACDIIWDADLLHRFALPERLELIAHLDRGLRVGGSWVSIARDHSGEDPRAGYPLSPEELAGYFSPSYQISYQEDLPMGAGEVETMTFATLVLTKLRPIPPSQLDLDLQRSIEGVAARRRLELRQSAT